MPWEQVDLSKKKVSTVLRSWPVVITALCGGKFLPLEFESCFSKYSCLQFFYLFE